MSCLVRSAQGARSTRVASIHTHTHTVTDEHTLTLKVTKIVIDVHHPRGRGMPSDIAISMASSPASSDPPRLPPVAADGARRRGSGDTATAGGGAAGCDSLALCRLIGGNGGRRGPSSDWHGAGGGWQCTLSVCPCATPGGKFTMRHCPGRASGGSAKHSASPSDLSRMICPTRNMSSVAASFSRPARTVV
eukprot:scaffold16800_cov58-Phaeocystis_antarctica.AAC.4